MDKAADINIDAYPLLRRAARILEILNAGPDTQKALFVGGCVRDALLKLPIVDVDIGTIHTPQETMVLLEQAGVKTVPTGIDHGTVTAILDGQPVQITTLRRDVETFGRRAVVSFSNDWREDAARRDFTINTLLANAVGDVYDPLGHGITDLQAGDVRFVGDAVTRIAEDYLRILRFFRFYGRYSQNTPDADALVACQGAADKIALLSKERVTQEYLRILAADNCADTLALMSACGVLNDLLSPCYSSDTLNRLVALQKDQGALDVMARLAVIAGCEIHSLNAVYARLILSNHGKAQVESLIKIIEFPGMPDVRSIQDAIMQRGNDAALSALLLHAARTDIEVSAQNLVLARDWQSPIFPLTGDDLMALGLEPGPMLGNILTAVRAWWIDTGFVASGDDCIACALELMRKDL